jgi:hypothetical protein
MKHDNKQFQDNMKCRIKLNTQYVEMNFRSDKKIIN